MFLATGAEPGQQPPAEGKETEMETAKLVSSVASVVAADREATAAKTEEAAAQVALVSAILEIVRPAVRALGTRPLVASEDWSGVNRRSNEERADWRGVPLTCTPNDVGPSRDRVGSSDLNGVFGGADMDHVVLVERMTAATSVFLREDGSLAELRYEGSWSAWQGTRCWWTSTLRVLSVEDFCRESADARPDELLRHLLDIVERAGDRAKATAAMRARASKYRALLALL